MSNDNGKVAFSLGGKKKKKTSSTEAKATAAAFARDSKSSAREDDPSQDDNNNHQPQSPLVIPLSQPTQSLLTRVVKQEEGGENNNNNNSNNNNTASSNADIKEDEETAAAAGVPLEGPSTLKTEPDAPVVSSSSNTLINNGMRSVSEAAVAAGDSSKDQLQRDLQALPDEANEESYEQVPVSQFGAALLRGMGWNEKADKTAAKTDQQGMPRPHRLGLGAIPKAPNPDDHMPSVLTGRRKKGKKLSVQQLQQQEEYEKKQKLLLQQDKQRTKQIGSIIYLTSNSDRRAKIVQLQGVPGLNMVLVQLEGEAEPTAIKKGEIGSLVERPELEERPFVIPSPPAKEHSSSSRKNGRDRDEEEQRGRRRDRSRSRESDNKDNGDRDRRRDGRGSSPDERPPPGRKDSRRRERSESPERDRRRRRDDRDRYRSSNRRDDRSRSRSPDDDVGDDRNKKSKKRERSRSPDDRRRDRKRDRSRSEERDSDDRKSDRKRRDRRGRDRDGERKRDKSDRKGKDRDRDMDRDRGKRRRNDEDDGDARKDKSSSRKRSKSDRQHNNDDSNPLWIIPNIRVRVVTEKLGRKYFKQKGVIVDVTRRHGATLRMDMTEGTRGNNSIVLEHVPERYLETALPKAGGNAIVLTGRNKWTKGKLLERNSKTSKGSIQIFEDMSILTLSLDDLAEWCGPLDDDLG